MTNKDPLVSIIIPCYNAEPWIAGAIDSCLAQSYQPIEVTAIDDGSTDGSLRVIRSYGDRIRYYTGTNRGGSTARNQGFALSKGDYVMFLDADDLISPETIAVLVKAISGHEKALVASTWYHLKELNGQWVTGHNALSPWYNICDPLAAWLTGLYIPPVAILWQRETIENLGGWDETLHINQDGDLVIRALLSGVSVIPVNGGAAYYRIHKSHKSVSKNRSRAALQSRLRVLEKTEIALSAQGRLMDYTSPLGQAYHGLAIDAFEVDTELARRCVRRSKELAGHHAITGSIPHHILCHLIGLERKDRLVRWLAKLGVSRRMRRQTGRRGQS